MKSAAGAALLVVLASSLRAAPGDLPGALVVLETPPGTPGSDPSAAPPRFVLLKEGVVFVGGTRRLETGRLAKGEASALQKRCEAVRKLPALASDGGRGGAVALGGEPATTFRLRLLDGKPLEVVATGDPAAAAPALAPLGELLAFLLRFDHPSLRPYAPASYALVAREGRLPGGCRAWAFSFPIAEVVAAPRVVPAAEAVGWPTGAMPAAVCVEASRSSPGPARRYVVTLRPLLPGERP